MSIIQFKQANCKNCYRCIRSCPVKAIAFRDEQSQILDDYCVLCGKCLRVCPQNAKSVKNDIDVVKGFISKKQKVYVSLAPSFAAAFDVKDAKSILAAIKKLGFYYIEETAVGAANVSKEYEKLLEKKSMTNIITSACPTVVYLIEKYYPSLINQLAPVVSPMIAHGKMMKEVYGPRIKVVFIGPCISKKEECREFQYDDAVDAAITFEELEEWMHSEGICFDQKWDEDMTGIKDFTSRLYPTPRGILKTLSPDKKHNYKCISVEGIDRCIEVLDSLTNGEVSNYFIEMNSCPGGCLGGPCMRTSKAGFLVTRDRLIEYAKKNIGDSRSGIMNDTKVKLSRSFSVKTKYYEIPDEITIHNILSKIGKFHKEQELNCGACGYLSCREKAIAVFNNKAELHMCLPYMRERAESISNIVLNSTPNAVFALNFDLCIQELNLSAQKLFNLNFEDFRGRKVFEVLNCADFETVRKTGRNILNKKHSYKEYGITVEQSILYIKEHHVILVFMKDITNDEIQQQQTYKFRCESVDIAQKVIEKQMRVAQEIASLLGETTAETKVALTKLKNSILSETGEK